MKRTVGKCSQNQFHLGKTHKSILSFIMSFWRFCETPLAKRHVEIYLAELNYSLELGHLLASSCRPTLSGILGTWQDVGLQTSINFDINLYLQGLQQVWECALLLHLHCHHLEMIRAQCLILIGRHFPVFEIMK